jgi:ATP synthase F1 delta subunit
MLRTALTRVIRPAASASASSSFTPSLFHSVRSTPVLTLTSATTSFARRTFADRAPPGVYGLSGKTASSIFNQAKEANALTQVSEDLNEFLSAYESSVGVRSALVNPLFKGAKRDELVGGILEKLEITNPLSQELLRWIIDTKQTGRLKKIVADFEKLAAFERKEVQAIVTTADPLTPEQVNKLTGALKTRIEPDEKLVLVQRVDPSVLGGLKVMVDNKLLDLTVANRINQIDRNLRAQDQES